MFYNCSSLESLELSTFNTSNVNEMQFMFYNCTSLKSLEGRQYGYEFYRRED